MTLDLVWALNWWTALDGDELKSFTEELNMRRKGNPALDACAKEAGI